MSMGSNEEVGIHLVVNGQTVFSNKIRKAERDMAKFRAEVKRNQTEVNTHATRMKELDRATSTFSRNARGAFSEAGNAVSNFARPLQTSLGIAQSAARTTITHVAGIGAAFTAAAGAVSLFGLKTGSTMEQATNQFANFLGSQEKGAEMVKRLQKFAAATPFDFAGTSQSATRLLNLGQNPDQVFKSLTAIGDAVAGASPGSGSEGVREVTRALSQISMAPTMQQDEVNQLQTYGLDPYSLIANVTGKTREQVFADQRARKISGKGGADLILKGFEAKYGGLMEHQNQTLQGQYNTFKETSSYKLAEANKPVAELLKNSIFPFLTGQITKYGPVYTHFLEGMVRHGQQLYNVYKAGGMGAMLTQLGALTGQGTRFTTVWTHIHDDSLAVANVWRGSLWPAIQDVASIVGPFAVGGLRVLEGTLHWMADHPDAAKAIIVGAGVAFGTYKITALVWGLTTSLGGLLLKLPLVQTEMYATARASNAMAMSGGFGGAGFMKGLAKVGAGAAGAGLLASGATADNFGAGDAAQTIGGAALLGGTIGSVVPIVGTGIGAAVGGLGGVGYSLYKMGGLPGQADGGHTIRGGLSLVGERGPEILSMQPGATVIPLDRQTGNYSSMVFHEGSIQIHVENGDVAELANQLIGRLQDKVARR